MAGRGAGQSGLLQDLRAQVKLLEDDLRARSDEVAEFRGPLEEEYGEARKAQRIAIDYPEWRDERITQIAVAWVLGTLFVRFCEDNGLIEHPWIAGPGDRLDTAIGRQDVFFRDHPHLNDRDWLFAAIKHLASCHPTAAGLFDRSHNPLWQVTPSYEAATELLRFWRRRDSDAELVHDFTDDELNTRFLGDLYQDLSDHAQKTYALLQTPEFVEEFILDLTLDPAVEEFGLEPELEIKDAFGNIKWHHVGLRAIDPACGSGHFLLGLFSRLLKMHRDTTGAAASVDDWTLIRKALNSIHGCDKNPFAASIARFRILIAVLKESGQRRLDKAGDFPIHVAVGDSLLHGRGAGPPAETIFDGTSQDVFSYATEDILNYSNDVDLLGKSTYHVVVANPPYIVVSDKQERDNYRRSFFSSSGVYPLSVPFSQRIFELAIRSSGNNRRAGFVGQITSNSFMKREFGKTLVGSFFHGGPYKDPVTKRKRDSPGVNLQYVIDTSGAYIPGHGTPTVILVGRNRTALRRDKVRAVLSVRGEQGQPEDPKFGNVWRAIESQIENPGSESDWVTVEDKAEKHFAHHPWSLSGGGASDVFSLISSQKISLGDKIESVGRTTNTGMDDAYFLPDHQDSVRLGNSFRVREVVIGESVRDFRIGRSVTARYPYLDAIGNDPVEETDFLVSVSLWPYRETLSRRSMFGKTIAENGYPWYGYLEHYESKFASNLGIAYAEVATHNYFALDCNGRMFKQTAPVAKLASGTTKESCTGLLGVLSSSTGCFWLKQVCHDKGIRGEGGGFTSDDWERFYQFSGAKVAKFPISDVLPSSLGSMLHFLAQNIATHEPSAITQSATPTRPHLDAARTSHDSTRRQMISLQEELDWQVYGLYNLLNDRERDQLISPDFDDVPEINLGERAFEIVLARKMAAGETETVWFSRHGSTPITEIPAHWPTWYRDVVQARIDTIEKRRDIALIERPECKRRWSQEPWEKREREALRTWLLDRCEDRSLWFTTRDGMDGVPRPMTVAELADAVASGPEGEDVLSVAELYAADHLGKPDLSLAEVLRDITADQHVPYLAALRYKDPAGLDKRASWERTWQEQREEDRTGKRLDIALPPKYTSADFRKPSYWANRGKLDVPKERFVSYPDSGPATDPKLVLGWAGWDHKQQAEALMNLVKDRVDGDDWGAADVAPLLAGVLELLPWLRQWHGDHDAEWGGVPAEDLELWLTDQREQYHLTEDDLRAWRPAPARRGAKSRA